ncbi:hypothetical protein [Vagococcus sp. WN89Y]|uniref:hypothetical protein n=1 Tax=Vagococcus sp. WN89Y TaxID=3457258 RepID=UPI003FCDD2B3
MVPPQSRKIIVVAYLSIPNLGNVPVPVYENNNPEMVDLGNGSKGAKFPAEWTGYQRIYIFIEVQPDGYEVAHEYKSREESGVLTEKGAETTS